MAYTCYIIGIGLLLRVKTNNATNFKKAFRHAGRLFETAVYGRLSLVVYRAAGTGGPGLEYQQDDVWNFMIENESGTEACPVSNVV